MRQPKHAELSAWSAKKLSKKSNLKSELGFSLLEIMITTAIGLIVSAGVATVFVFSMQQMHLLIEKNETEQVSQQISFYLQRYFGQAMNLQAVVNVQAPAPDCGCPGAVGTAVHQNCVKGTAVPQPAWAFAGCVDSSEGEGQLDFNFDLHGNANDSGTGNSPGGMGNGANSNLGRYYRLAIFNRETSSPSGSAPPALGSTLWPTAIFFRDPNLSAAGEADPVNLSYNIFFTTSTNTGAPASLLPSRGDLWFSRIHNFRVQPVTGCDSLGAPTNGYAIEVVEQNPLTPGANGILRSCLPANWAPALNTKYWVKTVTFEVTVRYFKSIDRSTWNYWFDGGNKWGTSYGDVQPPNMSGSYRDITQTVKINFRNNTLTNQSLTGGPGDEERVNGSLYFYNSYVPMSEVNW